MSWLIDDAHDGLVQGSEEWFKWRMKHLGASEIPTIMGTSDFGNNAHAVFIAKTKGALTKPEETFATERGKTLEPIIRSLFETRHGVRVTTPTLEYPEWPVLSASLDGLCISRGFLVEIKAPAFWKHTQAHCGLVPETYVDQIQTQLLVTGLDLAYYVSFSDFQPSGFEYAEVVVRPDPARQELILKRAKEFWRCVERGVYDSGWSS